MEEVKQRTGNKKKQYLERVKLYEHRIDSLQRHLKAEEHRKTQVKAIDYSKEQVKGGNHVCWFGLTWNLEHYQQANKRLHRQGQKEKVIIHHLVTQDTRDEDVMRSLDSKADVQEELLQSLKKRIMEVKKNVDRLHT